MYVVQNSLQSILSTAPYNWLGCTYNIQYIPLLLFVEEFPEVLIRHLSVPRSTPGPTELVGPGSRRHVA